MRGRGGGGGWETNLDIELAAGAEAFALQQFSNNRRAAFDHQHTRPCLCEFAMYAECRRYHTRQIAAALEYVQIR